MMLRQLYAGNDVTNFCQRDIFSTWLTVHRLFDKELRICIRSFTTLARDTSEWRDLNVSLESFVGQYLSFCKPPSSTSFLSGN